MAGSHSIFPIDARTVARQLGVSRGTLNGWLAKDRKRTPAEQKFNFHSYRGRKRVWSEAGFQALERAVVAESEDGGCLAAWRTANRRRDVSAHQAAAAHDAMLAVLGFRYNVECAGRPKASTRTRGMTVRPASMEA